MTFRYFVTFLAEEPARPRGLLTLNRDKEADRLDMLAFHDTTKRWESDHHAVTSYVFGEDYIDRRREVGRSEAEEAAAIIGTSVPSEEELTRISDEAEGRWATRMRRRKQA